VSLIGETKLDILRRLAAEPSHGYQLHNEVGVSSPVIYRHLSDLEDAGMVEGTPIADDNRGKTEYRITDDGRALLELLDE
jgi:DNA-binding PadR family transcriptional regulator